MELLLLLLWESGGVSCSLGVSRYLSSSSCRKKRSRSPHLVVSISRVPNPNIHAVLDKSLISHQYANPASSPAHTTPPASHT
jgi:hypothetical protein